MSTLTAGSIGFLKNIDTLNIFAPIYKKFFIRADQMPFITKGFSREIMRKSRLRNIFLKKKTEALCKAKKKMCVSLEKD